MRMSYDSEPFQEVMDFLGSPLLELPSKVRAILVHMRRCISAASFINELGAVLLCVVRLLHVDNCQVQPAAPA